MAIKVEATFVGSANPFEHATFYFVVSDDGRLLKHARPLGKTDAAKEARRALEPSALALIKDQGIAKKLVDFIDADPAAPSPIFG